MTYLRRLPWDDVEIRPRWRGRVETVEQQRKRAAALAIPRIDVCCGCWKPRGPRGFVPDCVGFFGRPINLCFDCLELRNDAVKHRESLGVAKDLGVRRR